MFHADLHVHSRFSRACSKDATISQLAWWAQRKGITVVGTGDFTHPAWIQELKEALVPAEPGLFKLGPDAERELRRTSPGSCGGPVRFMLSAEISTIYRGGDRTRKVHHLLYAPTFEAADHITLALSAIGNLASDGRPILGLDSRHLLEITLSGGPGCYLVPAHAWTPWFAVLGSKSGFDTVADCYGDLADHIFAIETGLSSDPPMNWRCSSLDAYRLVSNSDAHSPPMLGREATTFSTDADYFSIAAALRTGHGLTQTIEFYPEEGRYHLDGHRKCGVRFEPGQTTEHQGMCPQCRKPLTIGVAHRVAELADRPAGYRPPGAPGFTNLVQLPQIIGEITGVGPKSKRVSAEVSRLVAELGPELGILCDQPADDIQRAGGTLLAEAITRVRRGAVHRAAGYDGEYGVIRIFEPGELDTSAALFDLAPAEPGGQRAAASRGAGAAGDRPPGPGRPGPTRTGLAPDPASPGHPGQLTGLDAEQQAAAQAASPLLIIAGPGTGKTRTLAYRIAAQLADRGLPPHSALAITFTRRAAGELRDRLAGLASTGLASTGLTPAGLTPAGLAPAGLAPAGRPGVTVTTFHGLGLEILRADPRRAGLPDGFRVADDAELAEVAAALAGTARAGKRLLVAARTDPGARERLSQALACAGLVDFDGLIERSAAMLAADPAATAALRQRWPLISVDEYQDIDAAQYRLLRLLTADGQGLTVIGDPDQAIYGFRGADVSFFLRFTRDYPGAATRQLSTSYRSGQPIVHSALQAVAPATLVPDRVLRAVRPGPPVRSHQARDEHAEAAWIARTIDQLLGGASLHSLDSGRADPHGQDGLGLSDIAVLYRTDAQARILGQELARAGLPFSKLSHDALDRRAGVPDLVRELRLAAAAPGTVLDRLRQATATLSARVPGPRTASGRGRAGTPGGVVDVLSAGEILAPLARRCGTDLDRFLTEIALGAEADALDPRAAAVRLLTLHAAKGLEFEVVFVAGLERGLLPLMLPGAPARPDQLAEERRLLFVGMTRARSRLFLTFAASRARPGGTREAGPSPFLAAISPGSLISSGDPAERSRPAEHQLRLI
jgi:DNA helicase-2/ATP-dependent DNA helicase PcrA